MLGKNTIRKFVTLTTVAAVWCVYSMVAFAMPVDSAGEITVTGQVTVNGQPAVSNSTLLSGAVIGTASASSAEGSNSGGGLIGALVTAAVNQIVNNVTDRGFTIAGLTSQRLLSTHQPNGILYGPYSPKYGTD